MSTDLEFITQTLGNDNHIIIEKKLSLVYVIQSTQWSHRIFRALGEHYEAFSFTCMRVRLIGMNILINHFFG